MNILQINYITSDNIAIAALVLSMVSILFTFIERRDSSRVYVAIELNKESNSRIDLDLQKLYTEISNPVSSEVLLRLYGNGIAKDIQVEDYFILPTNYENLKNISISGVGLISTTYIGRHFTTSLLSENIKYDYLSLNENVDVHSILEAKIISAGLMMLEAFNQSDNQFTTETPKIAFRLNYKDVNDFRHRTFFLMTFHYGHFVSEVMMTYYISVKSINKNEFKAVRGLYYSQYKC